jgi:type I restriction enzyme S subunit
MDFKTFLENFDAIAEAPGGIPKLRLLILDLAVRGKLVAQNPEDEYASVLLDKIKFVKEGLIQEKKIKRDKPLSKIEADEIPYQIPQTWEWVRLIDVFDVRDGTHDSPKYLTIGIPFITSKNLYGGVLDLTNVKYISEEDHQKFSERSKVDKFDILFAMIGSIGNPVIVDNDLEFSIKNLALFKYYSLHLSEPKFLYHFLSYASLNMQKQSLGGVQSFVSLSYLRKYLFPLPPLAEQKRIVVKVDELMALCDRYEAAKQTRDNLRQKLRGSAITSLMNAKTDEELDAAWAFVRDNWQNLSQQPGDVDSLRKSVLQLALRGKLVPQDYTDESASVLLGKISSSKKELIQQGKIKKSALFSKSLVEQEQFFELPKTWKWARLDDITLSITDGEHTTPPRVSNLEVPLGTAKNIRDGFLDFNNTDYVNIETAEKCWRRCKPTHNDILMVCVGATTGRLCLIKEPPDFVIVRSVALIRTFANFIYPEYVALAINSPLLQQQVWSNVKQSAQPCLYINKIQILTLPIPPLAEQKRIVAKVDELMQLCDQLEASLRQSQQRAESLAASAISHLTI